MAEILNGIPFPGVTEVPESGEDNLFYSTANLVKAGFTFAEDATAGVLEAGTVVGFITDSGKAAKYNNANTDGTEVAVGILLDTIDVSDSDQLANVAIGGEFLADKLIGLDDEAIADLGAVRVNVGGTEVLRF